MWLGWTSRKKPIASTSSTWEKDCGYSSHQSSHRSHDKIKAVMACVQELENASASHTQGVHERCLQGALLGLYSMHSWSAHDQVG